MSFKIRTRPIVFKTTSFNFDTSIVKKQPVFSWFIKGIVNKVSPHRKNVEGSGGEGTISGGNFGNNDSCVHKQQKKV